MNAFDALGRDLHAAVERKVATRRRLRRAARASAVALALTTLLRRRSQLRAEAWFSVTSIRPSGRSSDAARSTAGRAT